ncbi:hypothetical protein [Candidatus Tisiphia endosymbiont of Oplodontha viridula]|uniref:hypothetical protein n=1 Tax=Candidatus Tisiphia endosymbiont of Oplodontha viridula TaxID=3077925 RepID=UPI0035C8D589
MEYYTRINNNSRPPLLDGYQEASIPDISNEQANQTDSEQVMAQVPQEQPEVQPWWQTARQEYAAIANISNNKIFKDKQ